MTTHPRYNETVLVALDGSTSSCFKCMELKFKEEGLVGCPLHPHVEWSSRVPPCNLGNQAYRNSCFCEDYNPDID